MAHKRSSRQLDRWWPWFGIVLITLLTASGIFVLTAQGTSATTCSIQPYAQNAELGPAFLPTEGPVAAELVGYERFGELTSQAFLQKFYKADLDKWSYPEKDGFQLDGKGNQISWNQTVTIGQYVDRYGDEKGTYLSPAGLTFAARALPPTSLNGDGSWPCNYHNYRVLKPFVVVAGPIAAWFGQPGGGLQYQLDSRLVPESPSGMNVRWLLVHGFLTQVQANLAS